MNIYRSIAATVCSHFQDILDWTIRKDGSCKNPRNVGNTIRIYAASYPKRNEYLQHRCENLRFHKTISIIPIYLKYVNTKLATLMHSQKEYGTYMFILAPYS